MKFLNTLIFALLLFTKSLTAYGNTQLKFRIQCGTTSDNISFDKFRNIPDLRTFTLPTGMKIYFSGGYFNKYAKAKKRLQEVHKAGLATAFIRVFKHNSLLSKSLGDQYIVKVKNKIALNINRDTVLVNTILDDPELENSRKIYSRAEVIKMRKRIAERKLREKSNKLSRKANIKDKETKENLEVSFDNINVSEPPVFKIFIGKSDLNEGNSKSFKLPDNEIVYSYVHRKEITYVVGFYKNEQEAESYLPKLKKNIKDAEIVGLYKGRIISLKLANELLLQFNQNNLAK